MKNGKIYSMYHQKSLRIVAAKKETVKEHTDLHWHDCCELELVVGGRGTHIINGNSYPIREGDLYFLTREDNHKIIADEPVTTLGIMFDEELVSKSLFLSIPSVRVCSNDMIANIGGQKRTCVEKYFENILSEESSENKLFMSELYISGLIECIIIELFRALTESNSETISDDAANRSLMYIHSHYAEDITLSSLAKEVHMSPNYLSSYFKNAIGKNFKDYLIELRIKHAGRLLANTNLSVTDICFSCGFSSYAHFIRTFRTRHGVTPLEFRKIHKEKNN